MRPRRGPDVTRGPDVVYHFSMPLVETYRPIPNGEPRIVLCFAVGRKQ